LTAGRIVISITPDWAVRRDLGRVEFMSKMLVVVLALGLAALLAGVGEYNRYHPVTTGQSSR